MKQYVVNVKTTTEKFSIHVALKYVREHTPNGIV